MHPAISYHLAQAHAADLRRRAERDTLARSARLAQRNQPGHVLSRLGAWAAERRPDRPVARMTRRYQRRRDSRIAQTPLPVSSPIGTGCETRLGSRPPDPNSGRAGDRFILISGVARTPTRTYPILSSLSEEGHDHNPE
jgi:hypothetical protein